MRADWEALKQQRQNWAFFNKTVVFTNGCFDIVHAGHIQYLKDAKRLGDILVVGLNSDSSVQGLKGSTRPIQRFEHRQAILSSLSMVDAVIGFDDPTPIPLIEQIRPDIHVKGGDYEKDSLPETEIVESYGGQVEILPFLPGCSSSSIIQKILDNG